MMDLLPKVKANLILEHDADDELIKGFIRAAVSYAESYQHKPEGAYKDAMPPTTEQAVIMLSSHFYESRDGSTGGFFADNVQAGQQVWNTVNTLLRLDRGRCEVSFGKMNTFIELISTEQFKDDEGFGIPATPPRQLARLQGGSAWQQRWANRAAPRPRCSVSARCLDST